MSASIRLGIPLQLEQYTVVLDHPCVGQHVYLCRDPRDTDLVRVVPRDGAPNDYLRDCEHNRFVVWVNCSTSKGETRILQLRPEAGGWRRSTACEIATLFMMRMFGAVGTPPRSGAQLNRTTLTSYITDPASLPTIA